MQTAQLIVWEPGRRWIVHFRRLMNTSQTHIRLASTQQDCNEMLSRWPASVVAITVASDQLGERLQWLFSARRRFPHARFIVLASPELSEAEGPIRESGAIDVVFGAGQLKSTVEIVQRRLAQAPQPELSLSNRILASLPWGD